MQNYRTRGDARIGSDFDIAENFRAGAYHHPAPHLGVAVSGLLAGAPQCDVLQDRDVIIDDGRRADDEAGRVIKGKFPCRFAPRG
jgi:hypothetical protein